MISFLVDLFLHLDVHLNAVIQQYGVWTYGLLGLTIFCETGLVVTPFLPGDSLLFAAGALAATGSLSLGMLFLILVNAAVIGDQLNYFVGRKIGPKAMSQPSRILKKEYLDKTYRFYEKHGRKTIVIARFVPIVRTFAPFMAGVGQMKYSRFLSFSVFGGLLWVSICLFSGYFFGNLPFVKKNFSLVVLAIIFISVLPALIEFVKSKKMSQPHMV